MRRFATLLDRLVFSPGRNAKLRLMSDYFATVPDPERGWALAALTGGLGFRHAKPALIRGLIEERADPVLFHLSYDFVGDLAETVALLWADGRTDEADRATNPSLDEIVGRLTMAGKTEVPGLLSGWLDGLDPTGRWGLLKLITGALRVGVSARLARTALAQLSEPVTVDDIEEVWHGLTPPYGPLFAWLDGTGPRPEPESTGFRPFMLANPLEEAALDALDPADFLAEWKWDGIRVQIAAGPGGARLYSRSGDEIGQAFPDLVDALAFEAVLDGELLVVREGVVAPFNDLQQRLNRKTVSAKLMASHPVAVRVYDLLFDGGEDLRPLPLADRRARLEDWHAEASHDRLALSDLVPFASWEDLATLRAGARASGVEGLMIKRKDSAYVAGRPTGPWFKLKRDPLTADCVLMYAQRGHGKRSSFYSDYTFGVWREEALVPVGKAYFGFTDEELAALDKWVRDNTTERFGPVRAVRPGLVVEVAFDSLHASKRHKSGLAMRFPASTASAGTSPSPRPTALRPWRRWRRGRGQPKKVVTPAKAGVHGRRRDLSDAAGFPLLRE